MSKLFIVIVAFTFTNVSFAFMGKGKGKGECAQKYSCKDKKDEEKISCWTERLACNKGKHQEKLAKLKTKVGNKNFAKLKEKKISRLNKRVEKSEEKLKKVQSKLAEMKDGMAKMSGDQGLKDAMAKKIKMKEARVNHINERIKMLNDYKSQIEALN